MSSLRINSLAPYLSHDGMVNWDDVIRQITMEFIIVS